MEVSKKRILIFGPIGNYGGRELETGFIAHVLSLNYDVDICTTSSLTKKSQVFDFDKNQKVFLLNDLMCDKYLIIKILAFVSYLKNNRKGVLSKYVNNVYVKKYFNYHKKQKDILDELLPKYDLVFICAHLSSSLMSVVIAAAKRHEKTVLFRTTGTIHDANYTYLNDVDYYIYHSSNNAAKLESISTHQYEIIDQCAFEEQALLKVAFPETRVNRFLVLSRLSPEKGITQIIEYFRSVCFPGDILYLAGNGILEPVLKNKYKDLDCIRFLGFVSPSNLSTLFKSIDCLIIPSPDESGPLVGIEAMCAGKIIISTRVGAMSERLKYTLNDFWYDYDNFGSFKKVFLEVKSLNEIEIKNISESLRNIYKKEYSINIISNKYLNVVNKFLK